ncbi:ISS1 [Symbiodinium pilosum]|uniref:ISS1 protein n=1 Tax=Symbiodinium pilosum TaxID=2952 RepID=A0A812W0N4_SYMPI|nr:ISS1 [Symbiodinium pilosum]
MKVQDTIAICPTVVSQKVALAALGAGREWVQERVRGLKENKRLVIQALTETLGPGSVAGGSGAIYLMAKLPKGFENDTQVVEWLSEKHRVCAIPGSACGAPGEIRVCYANLAPAKCEEAARRLKAGLSELREKGPAIFQ